MSNDLISDCLTRIRNAQRAGHRSVMVRDSRLVRNVLEVLHKEGYIERFEQKASEKGSKAEKLGPKGPQVTVTLRYYENGEPSMRIIRRISKSGRREYVKHSGMKRVSSGLGIMVISTPEGVMSDREAKKRHLGGEVLALVG